MNGDGPSAVARRTETTMDTALMLVSVVIPTHNRRTYVLRAVDALMKQDYPAESYEIIVCCDRCTDGTQEALKTSFTGRLRVLDAQAPGQTGACNTALACARGGLAIFIDDETEPEPQFVSEHVQAHLAEPDAKIAVTGYSPVIVGPASGPVVRLMSQLYEGYFNDLEHGDLCSTPRGLSGFNFSVPVAPLREVGGFNESYYCPRNDFELAVRLMERGFTFRFWKRACAPMHIALTGDTFVARAADNARYEYRLACEHPWCVPHLALYSSLVDPWKRRRAHTVWPVLGLIAPLLRSLRKVMPGNIRLMRWAYGVSFLKGLRCATGGWEVFSRLLDPVPRR